MDHKSLMSMEHIYADRLETERRVEMSTLMFEPITDEKEINDTLSSRSGKGEKEAFLHGLEEAFQAYNDNDETSGKAFIVPLNEREGTKFFGKATDSLYASLYDTLKKKELTKTWRLVRVKKENAEGTEATFLRIVRL
jgi:hypothetical protein